MFGGVRLCALLFGGGLLGVALWCITYCVWGVLFMFRWVQLLALFIVWIVVLVVVVMVRVVPVLGCDDCAVVG